MPTATGGTPPQTRVVSCKWCGGPVDQSRPWKAFCCDSCRYNFHNAERRRLDNLDLDNCTDEEFFGPPGPRKSPVPVDAGEPGREGQDRNAANPTTAPPAAQHTKKKRRASKFALRAPVSLTEAKRFEWLKAVYSDAGPQHPTTRAVLFVLSLHMGKEVESCFPGIDLLARESRLSIRTVKKHLELAVAEGWIARKRRKVPDRKYTSYFYKPMIPTPSTETQVHLMHQVDNGDQVQFTQGQVQLVQEDVQLLHSRLIETERDSGLHGSDVFSSTVQTLAPDFAKRGPSAITAPTTPDELDTVTDNPEPWKVRV